MKSVLIRIFFAIGVCSIIGLFIVVLSFHFSKVSSMELDSEIWNDWDAGWYDERRYNMALWLFKTNWFENKNKDDVLNELPTYRLQEILDNEVVFELKYSDEFMERWNIDYMPIPVAYLKIYFNEDDIIIEAELLEGKKEISIDDFAVTRLWLAK